MSNLQIKNGLTKVGTILTETKYRQSQATEEAKQAVGVTGDIQASMGIASVTEFIVIDSPAIAFDETWNVTGLPNDQAVQLVKVASSNVAQDKFDVTVKKDSTFVVSNQYLSGSQQASVLSQIVILPGEILTIKSTYQNMIIRLVFRLVSLLEVTS